MKIIRRLRLCDLMTGLLWSLWFLSGDVVAARLPDFTELVQNTSAAVVNISTTKKIEPQEMPQLPEGMDIPEGSPLEELFKHFFGQRGLPQETRSLGSGFIVSGDGYIVTNHHVVQNADEIIVRLQDRRELTAKLIGSDKRSDLALLKVEAKDLPVVRTGSSKVLEVGEWVVAIGSPFGFDHSVTAGIVSAKGRSLPGDNYVPFIQTDVAINPGNSGGPLFNMEGEVVGVNSQIYSRTGGFMGLSFAIPIDVALEVVEQLKAQGKVIRGWLGVQIQDVTRELAESFGMKRPHGALIAQVLAGSPAANAGLQVGDVIVEYDGHPIKTSSMLPPLVGVTAVGETVPVKVLREGSLRTLRVKIGQLSEDEAAAAPPADQLEPDTVKVESLGLVVADPSEEERQRSGDKGVVVRRVLPGPARQAGIRAGDLLLRVGKTPTPDVETLLRQLKRLPGDKPVAVLVKRGDGSLFLAIKPEETQ
ncbi:DegQ family serine endoprotease [Methylohalobius crimeensis]|uniref:DegQ family serine endoprotease n=1 Tax=Methylohalobius crimeensis TaxID=244365 RepID=UPI0038996475